MKIKDLSINDIYMYNDYGVFSIDKIININHTKLLISVIEIIPITHPLMRIVHTWSIAEFNQYYRPLTNLEKIKYL